ncbi:RTX toxin [Agrobacterium sp. a22-2]|uniref:RTX toxin n=1 Tax=Agrobacterium sp. a22-2 TaxID=2283840 RepID=UPI001447F709|nr:RTX toxin [Agrobacterium sp. a22-2]NKN37996.1 RTX toxin [Agrobacterium sp. a22-2]
MAAINAFYRSANAVSYATQLFSGNTATNNAGNSGSLNGFRPLSGASDERSWNDGAAERALSRIIEILALGDSGDANTASVEENLGYITGATGTEGDDTLTLTGRAVYNVSTAAGDDTLTVKTAAVAGIDSGDGNDTLNIASGFVSDITAGAGDDTVQMSGKLAMNISGGDGKDTIKISADAILGVDGGDGDDTLYLEGSRIFAAGGTGNDTVTFNNTGNQTDGGEAEYAFARGDGMDTVNTNGPLSIRFAGTEGYSPDDMTIAVSGNSLSILINGSDDKITVNFDEGTLDGDTPAYEFTMDQGAYALSIR